MHPFDQMKRYVGFTEADTDRLRAMLPFVRPHLESVSERFYAAILEDPGASAVFEDEGQVRRLMKTLMRWTEELLTGPHDHAYYEKRLRIGRVHVEVGLQQQYMFTAMNLLRRHLLEIFEGSGEPGSSRETCFSLLKITDLELAIMLGTYAEERQRHRMEALRDVLFGHLPITAALVGADGRVTAATPALHRRAAEWGGGDLRGRPYTDALPPGLAEAAAIEDRIAEAAETGEGVLLPRVEIVEDGVRRSFMVRIVPVEHPLARTLLYLEDTTAAIATEARIRQQESLAELGTLAAAVAHEIRNPLAGISGTMQVILGSLPDEDRRRPVLGKVLEQIGRLSTMVTDLLEFARPVAAQSSQVDLRQVAFQVASQAVAAGFRPARITGDGRAEADENLLRPALLNLIQNAWQAGAREVEIRVSSGRLDVWDDGPGIPPELRARIFQPFFTTRVRGTGLGLPNARRAMEAMDGSLELVPSPLGGAGFTLRFPDPAPPAG